MIHYIKQNFLPRDISLLTRTTINGSGSGEQVFLIFLFMAKLWSVKLFCSQATKGMLAPIFGVDWYQHTHSSPRNLMVLTGSLGKYLCPSPQYHFLHLPFKRYAPLPYSQICSPSLLVSLPLFYLLLPPPSPSPLSFGYELCYPLKWK